ncbi:MAG: hypothetical protein KBD21_00910 [Candidatus Pacebacteria bacterium]|nr:hypothetical protein [Candidatus Paceibacterota bacterium]
MILKECSIPANFCYAFQEFLNAWQKDDVQALDNAWDIERHRDSYPGGGLELLVSGGYLARADLRRACLTYINDWLDGKVPYIRPAFGTMGFREVLAWLGFHENVADQDLRSYVTAVATRVLYKIRTLASRGERGHLYQAFLSLLVALGAPYPQTLQGVVGELVDAGVIRVAREHALIIRYADTDHTWHPAFDVFVMREIVGARRLLGAPDVSRSQKIQSLEWVTDLLLLRYRGPNRHRYFEKGAGEKWRQAKRKVWNVLQNQGVLVSANRYLNEGDVAHSLRVLR